MIVAYHDISLVLEQILYHELHYRNVLVYISKLSTVSWQIENISTINVA